MTILFENDWRYIPSAFPDYHTKNESFLRLVTAYKEIGISNCLFPLALHDPSLQGIDPHSTNLTREQKIRIGIECESNYWYYLREVVRIPPIASSSVFPFRADRGNIAASWLFLCHVDFTWEQIRQTGKSVGIDCIMNHLLHISASNSTFNMVTLNNVLRNNNVERIKRIRDAMPPYLVPLSGDDADNQVNLTCKLRGNKYIAGVNQKSVNAANMVGRGMSSPVNHFDEMAFLTFVEWMIPPSLSASSAAREEAKGEGKPYGNVFTTTSGMRDDRDGRFGYNFCHAGAVFNERLFDARDRDTLIDIINKAARGSEDNQMQARTLVNMTMNHRQLGRSDEWLRERINETVGSRDYIRRNYFNEWTSGSQVSPLTSEQNEAIRQCEKDPDWVEITKDNYTIRWHIKVDDIAQYMENNKVAMGVDTSDAIGRDACAFVFINTRTLEVVAVATINESNMIYIAQFSAMIMIRWKNITMIIERHSSGPYIADALLVELPRHNIDPFTRLYNTVVEEKNEKPKNYAEVFSTPMSKRDRVFYDRWKSTIGFRTTGNRRDFLYSTVFQKAVQESQHLIRDRTLATEIRSLVIRNSRVDHSTGAHDDHVIAWLLANWLLSFGRNLSDYGLQPEELLTQVSHNNRKFTIEDELAQRRRNKTKEEIDEISELLCSTTDEYRIASLTDRLRALSSRYEVVEDEAISIDQLLRQAEESRQTMRRQQQIDRRRQLRSTSNPRGRGAWNPERFR